MVYFLFFAALLIRLLTAHLFFGPWDTESVYVIAELLKKGSLIYNDTWRFNTPPTWMWIIGSLSFIADKIGVPLSFLIKLPPVLADLGIGIFIYKFLFHRSKRKKSAIFLSSLFLLNPLPVLISGYQGQPDSMFIFLVLLSSYVLTASRKLKLVTIAASGLLLGISCTVKLVPFGLLPIFLLYLFRSESITKKSLLSKLLLLSFFTFLTFLPVILEFIPYLAVWSNIVEHVFQYKTWWSLWGVSLLLRKLNEIWFSSSGWFFEIIAISKNQTLSVITILLLSYIVIFFKRWSLTKSILFLFLTEYAISSYLAPQYLIWILPFFILEYCKNGKYLYSFIAYSILTFLAASTIYLFWSDETLFQYLGNLLKTTDIAGLGFNLYALQMIFPWIITLWWWKKMIFD
ncbi:MAG: hypothetical protein M1120_01720 [Patescibacteria group bacterium]|nr:hypothetical protein [Patescibacteria group bacterium]